MCFRVGPHRARPTCRQRHRYTGEPVFPVSTDLLFLTAPREAHGQQQCEAAHAHKERRAADPELHQPGGPWIRDAVDSPGSMLPGKDSNGGDAGEDQEQHAA